MCAQLKFKAAEQIQENTLGVGGHKHGWVIQQGRKMTFRIGRPKGKREKNMI